MRRKNSEPITHESLDRIHDDEANKGRGSPEIESSSVSSPDYFSRQAPVVERRRQNLWYQEDPRQIKKIDYPVNKSQRQKIRRRNRLVAFGYTCLFVSLSLGLYGIMVSVSEATKFKKTTIILPENEKIPLELIQKAVRSSNEKIHIVFNGTIPVSRRLNPGEFPYTKEIFENEYFGFRYPQELDEETYQEGLRPHFGPLDIRFITEENQRRNIYRRMSEREGNARTFEQERDDDVEPYWLDDDFVRNPYYVYDDDQIRYERRCRKTSWHKYQFPSCNIVHEISLLENHPTFVGEGAYREVFIVDKPYLNTEEQLVIKELRFDLAMMYDDFEYIRVDSLITERMTSNPQIVNMYGFCGFTMVTECFSNGDVEESIVGYDERNNDFRPHEEPLLRPRNNFTGSQKLQLALSMVEPVAALHHFKDGVIIHDDIQLSQFLWTDDTKTSVKLNDFNRAEVMFWDEEHQEYCKYRNGRGHGDWRAPEEYRNDPLDETIDVFSLGNNFYSLLTGYYPFYAEEEDDLIKMKIGRGQTAVIDPRYRERSFAERKLVEVIERCYVFNPDERADINEIQQMLEEAIAEDNRRKEMGIEDEQKPGVHYLPDDFVDEEEDSRYDHYYDYLEENIHGSSDSKDYHDHEEDGHELHEGDHEQPERSAVHDDGHAKTDGSTPVQEDGYTQFHGDKHSRHKESDKQKSLNGGQKSGQ